MAGQMTTWIPGDDFLAAMGAITVRHGQLDYAMRLAIKKLKGEKLKASLQNSAWMVSGKLSEKVVELVTAKLDPPEQAQLKDMMDRAAAAVTRSNEFRHSVYFKSSEGKRGRERKGKTHALPTPEELRDVANDLRLSFKEVSKAQMDGGWLRVAMQAKGLI